MSTKFSGLSLHPSILKALKDEGYEQPTPIQCKAIPAILNGRDVLGTAQTGTGKTAAFSLPMLQFLDERNSQGNRFIRGLVLTPTRELALQIQDSFRTYGRHVRLSTECVMGGVAMGAQIKRLRNRPDILVATPGRLLDLMRQKIVRLDKVEMLVLDEADRMLDMGFIKDVKSIVSAATRKNRQTMLFSATLSDDILDLVEGMLRDPERIVVTPPATVVGAIDQRVMFVDQANKAQLLTDVLRKLDYTRALVFTRTKHKANRLSAQLSRKGIKANAIHGNKTQGARQAALTAFHKGSTKVLVATDIVARGIDVDGITHVINYELPDDPESYVHRIGRTARAGASGVALSFCAHDEVPLLRGIEKLTRTPITPQEDHAFHSAKIATLPDTPQGISSSRRGQKARGERNGSSQQNGSSQKGSSQNGTSQRKGGSKQNGQSHRRRRPDRDEERSSNPKRRFGRVRRARR